MKTSSEDSLACRSARPLARLVRGPLSFERAGMSSRVVKWIKLWQAGVAAEGRSCRRPILRRPMP
jgi:hypothetical protein